MGPGGGGILFSLLVQTVHGTCFQTYLYQRSYCIKTEYIHRGMWPERRSGACTPKPPSRFYNSSDKGDRSKTIVGGIGQCISKTLIFLLPMAASMFVFNRRLSLPWTRPTYVSSV
ncbi:hypothetical protein BDY19DRAFT_171590 [Irpex rosettiformis]|uniref:Uncharacterized protein n=1 Tax=Irpex rosettiformis TaxID=378272 RepID=A0ACB8U357_9APHY|nr:hypothetical protein BDY19DRAFT_171590 [Irpex rosettiformis]